MEDQAEYKINVCPPPVKNNILKDSRFDMILNHARDLLGVLRDSNNMLDTKLDMLLGVDPRDVAECEPKPSGGSGLVDELLDAQDMSLKAALAIQERIATI